MIQCQNCGQVNNYGSNFCRFCGARMVIPQNAQPLPQTEERTAPPRPYMWQTDEFQVKENPARRTQEIKQVQPLVNPQWNPPAAQQNAPPMPYQKNTYFSQGYRCPRCGTPHHPVVKKKVSTAGWVVFAVLLVFFLPLFWIGLLIKEDARICPVCNVRIG